MIKTIAKRFLPLFLVLVVLISLFPSVPAFAAEASSSDGESFTAGTDISSGEVAAAADYTVSGVWKIKDSPSISSTIQEPVNFVSNGSSFTRFDIKLIFDSAFIYYYTTNATTVYSSATWASSAYQTVDFGSSPQSVSAQFYNWLTSNATKQQTKTTYCVYVDGSLATSWSVAASSVKLDLRVHEDSISVGFPEHDDEYYSVDYSGSPYLFGGMCKHDVIGCCDYMVSSSPYTITLDSSKPILYLTCAYKYPLYIDPNGGTWNGISDISEFWEFAGTDTEDIVDPVRDGYTFDGWTLSGVGELNDAGDPPHIYQHGVGSGTLTASWTQVVVPTYTHTISIDGSSYSFTADNAAPPVTIEVTSSGITMSYGDTTKTWTYSGTDTFVGIQDSSGNICYVGSSFSVLGSSGSDLTSVLTPLTEAPSQEVFVTLVKLYDSSGNSLLTSFIASSAGGSPSATLAIGEKHLVFDSPALDSSITWNYTGDGTILGIALSANATSPSYTPGQTMVFSGVSGQGSVTSIYLITDSSSAPEPDPEYVIEAGQWECNSLLMTGEYVDLSAWPQGLTSIDLSFVSAGRSFSQMSYQYDISNGYSIYYGSTLAYSYGLLDDPAWLSDIYAQIYFAADQTVSQAFYEWFISNFTRTGDDQVQPQFSSTVVVYDNFGSVQLGSYSLSASGVAPVFTLTVSDNGLNLYSDDVLVWTWEYNQQPFYGFAWSLGTSAAVFIPGQTYVLPGGEAADFTLTLYVVDTDVDEGEYRTGVLGWLERIYDMIAGWFDNAFSIPEISSSMGVVDFGSVGSFFVDMYNQVKTVFGLKTFMEDPAGPFAWLMAS